MEDSANYTCVASNGVSPLRKSSEAQITVYVPAKWEEWGEWSQCNKKCGRGAKTRTRTCSSPHPLKNGMYATNIKYCHRTVPLIQLPHTVK